MRTLLFNWNVSFPVLALSIFSEPHIAEAWSQGLGDLGVREYEETGCPHIFVPDGRGLTMSRMNGELSYYAEICENLVFNV